MKDKWLSLWDKVLRNSKFAFPIIVIVAAAITVVVAMSLGDAKADKKEQLTVEEPGVEETPIEEVRNGDEEVLLVLNEDPAIEDLVTRYYNAVAAGDKDTLTAVVDVWEEQDFLRGLEMAKYVDSYSQLEIHTKPGYHEGDTIAFVYYKMKYVGKDVECPGYRAHYICTNDQGELYFKKSNYTEEENEYIMKVTSQADVVEFNNRVTVEYNDLILEQPDLLTYMNEVVNSVQMAVGEILAQQNADASQSENGEDAGQPVASTESSQDENEQEPEALEEQTQAPQEEVKIYAKATTTVNVRGSDSEKADKLGKVAGGTKLQVLEQKINGWTKVLYEGKEGYIKSEFLDVIENASEVASIGTVKATSNVNVRAAASETADRLGILTGGDEADLIARENGWCKIKYQSQIGYVKEDFVE